MKYKLEDLTKREDEIKNLLDDYAKADKKAQEKMDMEKLIAEDSAAYIQQIEVTMLVANKNNHFHKIEGEQWEEFVGSIKNHGIITPCIVRAVGETFEILAGHNRVAAAKEVGLDKVPCRVIECDDVEASVIVGITNNQRENTTELEWGWAYRTTYETIKSQGKRTDLTSSHSETKLRSDEIIAAKYGVGRNTVQRKMRLTYLVEPLYQLYANKKISQQIVLDLSYLSETNQINAAGAVTIENCIITEEIAKELRKRADEEISVDEMNEICARGGKMIKKVRPKRYCIDEELFPADLKKQNREQYIAAAIRYVQTNNINLMDME